jgi:nicotinamidase-related amidase
VNEDQLADYQLTVLTPFPGIFGFASQRSNGMKLEPSKTAVLTLDLQQGILAMGKRYESIISNASQIVGLARKKNYQLIHVGLGFSEGYPEVADLETPFLKAKQNNLFVKGSASAEFHSAIAQPDDLIIYKQRISAFSENHLNLTLRVRGIVLATVTRAFDLDFRLAPLRPDRPCARQDRSASARR